jgi:E3 ubiquitin-protein ligase HERC2
LGNPHAERELLPKPIEALRGVRVGSIAAAGKCSYAVADTGVLFAWEFDSDFSTSLGHGEQTPCLLPKPIESLRGVKVDAVTTGGFHTLAQTDDGGVYAWSGSEISEVCALGLGPAVGDEVKEVHTPRRVLLVLGP